MDRKGETIETESFIQAVTLSEESPRLQAENQNTNPKNYVNRPFVTKAQQDGWDKDRKKSRPLDKLIGTVNRLGFNDSI